MPFYPTIMISEVIGVVHANASYLVSEKEDQAPSLERAAEFFM